MTGGRKKRAAAAAARQGSENIKFPVDGIADVGQGLLVVLKFSGIVKEHHAEDHGPDHHQLPLPDLGGVAGGLPELGVEGLGQRAELGPLFVVEIVEILVLQHENGPVLGVIHEEADVAHDDLEDLLPERAAARSQDLLLPGSPDLVDIVNDGSHEFLFVLEMPIGSGAGNVAGHRNAAQGEILGALVIELPDTCQDQRLPQIGGSFRHKIHPFVCMLTMLIMHIIHYRYGIVNRT